MSDVLAVIPARYGSTRFPAKPLALIAGVPMIARVVHQVQKAQLITRVLVATDDERIAEVARAAGAEVAMTPSDLPSGTDRVWAASSTSSEQIVINVQGDEPLVDPDVLDALVDCLSNQIDASIATPVLEVPRWKAMGESVVTAVVDKTGRALYFSRMTLPFGADHVLQHIGVYAYRRAALERFVSLPPSRLEELERLEQLRALDDGMQIATIRTVSPSIAVDRAEDIALVERALQGASTEISLSTIRMVVVDVDGVLTDGKITYQGNDDQIVSFDVRDGHGIVMLLQAGIEVAIVSGRDSLAVRRRAAELGVTHVYAGRSDKLLALQELEETSGLHRDEMCFVGDDLPDLRVMALVGMSAAPQDAVPEVREASTVKLSASGGRGALRELAEMILTAKAVP